MLVDPQIEEALNAIPAKIGEDGYDLWGMDPKAAKIYFSLAKWVYRYFRPEIVGIENLPPGRVLVAANHSGQFPFDGLVINVAALLHAKPPRLLRTMVERWAATLPYVNVAFSRSGVVTGDPINCRNLLEADNGILVFPEGGKGSGKPFSKRYQLQPFGRGFMRLALQTRSPIVPVAVVGAEESIISLMDLKPVAKLLKTPYFPLPALLPLLGPLAFAPLPTKFHVHFGEPLYFDGPFDDEDEVIQQKVHKVEKAVKNLMQFGLSQREGWF